MTPRSLGPPVVGRSYSLPRGPRVRLRMVQPRDATAVRAFLADVGVGIGELELARLLHFDPRRRAVICASALVGAQETIAAVGAIDLDAASPDLVLVAADPEGILRRLLTGALFSRTRADAA